MITTVGQEETHTLNDFVEKMTISGRSWNQTEKQYCDNGKTKGLKHMPFIP